ncbi:MAG: hypothetical protein MJZ74_02535 [Muribaculaceae bacterium]|nr:hypothetical protein [Muribaculaceae bacterium]
MKKIIFVLLLLVCSVMVSHAEVYKYKTSSIALRTTDNYGNWGEWSDWEDCNVLVVWNTEKSVINIYSATPQEFDVYEAGDKFKSDASGGKTWSLKCVDADGVRCTIRLRVQSDGQSQLYVDYSNISYVYTIEPRN